MVSVLKTNRPIARKEHKCQYCECKINIGERYEVATCCFEGTIYDWKSHCDCADVSSALKMYDNCDDQGLGEESFHEFIDEYVYEKHYDSDLEDIAKDWQLPYNELSSKILEEIKAKKGE